MAKILEADIGKITVTEGKTYSPTYFFPLAYFEYSYKGEQYKSNRYALDRKSIRDTDVRKAEAIVEALKASDQIKIFINPRDPKMAVIETAVLKERWSHAYALIIGGALVCLVGLGVVFLSWGH